MSAWLHLDLPLKIQKQKLQSYKIIGVAKLLKLQSYRSYKVIEVTTLQKLRGRISGEALRQ